MAAATAWLCPAHAQQNGAWTLEQCIDYAISHNISVKQNENQLKKQEIQLSTAKNQMLPDLNASASESVNFGRGLTADNTFANRSTNSTSFSLSTSVPLFTGFRITNNIKINRLNLDAATADLEKAKNDISVQVLTGCNGCQIAHYLVGKFKKINELKAIQKEKEFDEMIKQQAK